MINPSAAALGHLKKAGEIQYARIARNYRAVTDTAAFLAANGPTDFKSMEELAELQLAVWQRLCALGFSWWQAWDAWGDYAGQVEGANTASKLAERYMNLFAQAGQILGDQATELTELQENAEVSYGFWISRKP
jgi:hypothetical protein